MAEVITQTGSFTNVFMKQLRLTTSLVKRFKKQTTHNYCNWTYGEDRGSETLAGTSLVAGTDIKPHGIVKLVLNLNSVPIVKVAGDYLRKICALTRLATSQSV